MTNEEIILIIGLIIFVVFCLAFYMLNNKNSQKSRLNVAFVIILLLIFFVFLSSEPVLLIFYFFSLLAFFLFIKSKGKKLGEIPFFVIETFFINYGKKNKKKLTKKEKFEKLDKKILEEAQFNLEIKNFEEKYKKFSGKMLLFYGTLFLIFSYYFLSQFFWNFVGIFSLLICIYFFMIFLIGKKYSFLGLIKVILTNISNNEVHKSNSMINKEIEKKIKKDYNLKESIIGENSFEENLNKKNSIWDDYESVIDIMEK